METLLLNQQILDRKKVDNRLLKKIAGRAVMTLCLGLCLFGGYNLTQGFIAPGIGPIFMPSSQEMEAILSEYSITEPIKDDTEFNQDIFRKLQITTYKVKKSDTLTKIAENHRLRIDTVISFNNIKNARNLKPGDELKLPNHDGIVYRVRSGNSLEKIASVYNIALNNLLDWNDIKSEVIKPGQELFIPGARLTQYQISVVLGKLFLYPTVGKISSKFGKRKNPFTGVDEFHYGLDLANVEGTPIKAAMTGIVAMVGNNSLFGKYIIINHEGGFQTLYGHLGKVVVSKGKYVQQGELIGNMGNTGYSTGFHLHFSIFKNKVPVDPLLYLN